MPCLCAFAVTEILSPDQTLNALAVRACAGPSCVRNTAGILRYGVRVKFRPMTPEESRYQQQFNEWWAANRDDDPDVAAPKPTAVSPTNAQSVPAGRFPTLNAFVDLHQRQFSLAARVLWFALWRHADPAGTARVSQTRLMEQSGVSRSTVTRAIGELVRGGALDVVRKGNPRSGISAYRIRLPEQCVNPDQPGEASATNQ